MNRLLWAVVGAAGLLASLNVGEAQAQTPSPTRPNPNVPSFVTNPWGNPAFSYYQRQREMREQRALQQGIAQLQRLELLKARNSRIGATGEESADAPPKASFHLPKSKAPLAAAEKVGSGKLKPMKPADKTASTTSDEPPEKMEKVLDRRRKQVGGKAPTYSNGYKALVPGRQ